MTQGNRSAPMPTAAAPAHPAASLWHLRPRAAYPHSQPLTRFCAPRRTPDMRMGPSTCRWNPLDALLLDGLSRPGLCGRASRGAPPCRRPAPLDPSEDALKPLSLTLQRAWLGAVVALPLTSTALAQARPHPLDPSAPVPALVYRSSLGEHRSYQASEVGSWRNANETVNRIGGWRAYAREAEAPTSASGVSSPPSQPAATAAPPASMAPAAIAAPPGPPAHRHR
jgi:hypothetical protein